MTDKTEARLRELLRHADRALPDGQLDPESTIRRASRQRMRMIGARALGVAAALLVVAGLGFAVLRPQVEHIAPVGPGPERLDVNEPADLLWNRTFYSVSVSEDGEPRVLVPGTRIRVDLVSPSAEEGAGWGA
jgi:hypothetical protein